MTRIKYEETKAFLAPIQGSGQANRDNQTDRQTERSVDTSLIGIVIIQTVAKFSMHLFLSVFFLHLTYIVE